jgi:hypothetical protein
MHFAAIATTRHPLFSYIAKMPVLHIMEGMPVSVSLLATVIVLIVTAIQQPFIKM